MAESEESGEDLFRGAVAALEAGRLKPGVRGLQACVDAGDPDHSARTGAMLADLAILQGDLDGADRLARTALDRGAGEGRAAAAMARGGVEAARGDAEAAGRWFREVMETGPPAKAAMAAFNLGMVLATAGDLDGARAALAAAIDSGNRDAAPRAAVNLGILLAGAGDVPGATAAFAAAAAGDDPRQSAKARLNLLVLRRRHREPGDPPPVDDPAERVSTILELQVEAAQLLFASARGVRDPDLQINLYVSLLEVVDKIVDLAQTADEFGRAVDACRGAVRIGEMLAKRHPLEPSHHTLGPNAAVRLGDLHLARSAPKDARKWYDRAYRSAVRLARSAPRSAVGPLNAVRACRRLATADPDRALGLLEKAATWLATATEREAAHVELAYERGVTFWRLATLDPSCAPAAAAQVVEDFGDQEGRLPPEAAEALRWARATTAAGTGH